jgi:ABC-2 type transport system ATP-binding protein
MPALRVSNLGRSVRRDGGELAVLQGVGFAVAPGQAVGLTGPLDSGWRSVLRLIVGLDPATEGSVELEGARPGREELRQEVIFASALAPLLDAGPGVPAKIARLVASRRRGVRSASWDAVVAGAGVASRDGPWSRSERLRLCVALASLLSPSHLLLEVEPALEAAEDRAALGELLRKALAGGAGLVLGTRDELLLATTADRVLIFEDGSVLAEGTPESVLPAAWRRTRGRESP